MNRLAFFLILAAVFHVTESASAMAALRTQGQQVTALDIRTMSVTSGVPVTAETLNLSSGGDTVLHVQKYPDGSYIAGNDDFSGLGLGSRVTFTPTYTGLVWVIVRAYGWSHGTGTLRWTVGGNSADYPIAYGGWTFALFEAVTSGVAYTAHEQGGASDVALLAIKDTAYAVAFDDDDGMENQPYLSFPGGASACSPDCTLIVGTYGGSTSIPTTTTLVVDEDRWNDNDFDGLGNALETAIGTGTGDVDSDDDGIPDGYEVAGYGELQSVLPNVKFPYYGANPLVKDIFFEVDYQIHSGHKMTSYDAEEAAARWSAAGITAHIDIGQTNSNSATWHTWGDWGGTDLQSTDDHCAGFTPSRAGLFHHANVVVAGGGGGQFRYEPYPCYTGSSSYGLFTHETGHFRLAHSGQVPENASMDCNPHYRSVMNQAYFGGGLYTHFSAGAGAGITYPTAISETGWSGQPWLNDMSASPWSYTIDPLAGKIDWNRNGIYDSGLVRAAPTWANSDCDPSGFARNELTGTSDAGNSAVAHPILTWVAHPNGTDGKLFLIGRNRLTGKPRYATASFANVDSCKTYWARWFPCVTWSSFQDVPFSAPQSWWGASEFGLAAVDLGTAPNKLLLVYRTGQNVIEYQTATVSFPSGETWSGRTTLNGSNGVSTDIAGVRHNGTARFYVGHSSQLYSYVYDPSSSAWTYWKIPQTWETGGVVSANYGIALAQGHLAGQAQQVFALIPGTDSKLQFAEALGITEFRLHSSVWPLGQPTVTRRPGLAYVSPTDNAVNGRFYIAYPDANGGDPGFEARIGLTEGNDSSPSATGRRLQVRPAPVWAINRWSDVDPNFGVSLIHHPVLDSNVRMVWTNAQTTAFLPLADGIVSFPLFDWNDQQNLLNSLDCGLYGCCNNLPSCPYWM